MKAAFFTLFVLAGTPAVADVPSVATDILPVHSLVARVMEGVGEPELVLPPGASPHGYSMRPSEARILERADLVFWIGEGLTPWLEGPLDTVAEDASKIALLEHPSTHRIEVVEEDEEEEEHADHDGHDHGPVDPHAWLDPGNAREWLAVIAAALSDEDSENAARYRANAEAGQLEIDALVAEMETLLTPGAAVPFAVYHDAYRYLEEPFGLRATASLLDGDAAQPSPRRIADARELAVSEGVRRIFLEPQTNVSLVETIFDGLSVTACEIDPIGAEIAAGAKHYWDSMRAVARVFGTCGVP